MRREGFTVDDMSYRSLVVRLLAVAVIVTGALLASPAPAATPAEVKYGNKVHQRVNDVRDNHDLVRLKKNKCLQRFANKQAEKMARDKELVHQDLGKILDACDLRRVGENLVAGPGTPGQQVKVWMGSPPHRANILRKSFRITGVAARKSGGVWWVAQVFGRK